LPAQRVLENQKGLKNRRWVRRPEYNNELFSCSYGKYNSLRTFGQKMIRFNCVWTEIKFLLCEQKLLRAGGPWTMRWMDNRWLWEAEGGWELWCNQ
jgi:hypothetical protein